ncbi:MAG: helix-hairpin-helix domain-containing protein [bacterium]
MEEIKEFIFKNKISIAIISVLLILLIIVSVILFNNYNNFSQDCISSEILEQELSLVENNLPIEDEEDLTEYIYIDVKGSIKNPGVYEIEKGSIVNDAITLAGGTTSGAIVDNINLSKLLTNEMVIYVFNKSEYTSNNTCIVESLTDSGALNSSVKTEDVYVKNELVTEDSNDEEDKTEEKEDEDITVNINTATKEQLMTLPGIGETKAISIIAHRDENGDFDSIEDIVNVSGIGDSTLDAIKEFITI